MSVPRPGTDLPVGLPETRWDFAAPAPAAAALGAVHLLAVGGAGMSAVAALLAARGVAVSGCDGRDSQTLASLAAGGLAVAVGHDVAHLSGVDTLVVSSAIRETNPELAAARARGLRVLHRSQALSSVAAQSNCRFAVAGANGKTTTSAMLAVTLTQAGVDCSYAVGGEPTQLPGNAHLGQDDPFVIEADESDGSFVVYRPHTAIVTSVQPDHLDFYGDLAAVAAAYRAFVRTIAPGGLLVACADDPGAAALADWAAGQGIRVVRYGTDPRADVLLTDLSVDGLSASATVTADGQRHRLTLPVPGRHNLLNAAAVLAALLFHRPAGQPELPEQGLAGWSGALAQFAGVRRRFERLGSARGVAVVDDYAHNPAKVAAVVTTGRAVVTTGRLVVVFQPHLYSRTRDFAEQFGAALADADVLVVTDVYAAREDPLPGVSGELVVRAARAAGCDQVRYVPDRLELPAELARLVTAGDLVLTVGAGDITDAGPALLELLGAGS